MLQCIKANAQYHAPIIMYKDWMLAAIQAKSSSVIDTFKIT